MPGASLPSTDAVALWADNTDNWRAADADFLQRRAILRFSTAAARTASLGPNVTTAAPIGQFTYVANGGMDGNGGLEYVDATGSWRSVMSLKNLTVSDVSSAVSMRLATDSTSVLSVEAGRVVLGSSRILSVEATKLVFKTGATSAELSTDADSFVSSVKFKAPSASLGAVTSTSIDNTGGTLATASLSATGNVTANTLTASVSAALGATSVTSLAASAGITGVTVYGSTSVRGGSVLVSGSRAANYTAATQFVEMSATTTTIAGDSLIIAPTATTTAVRYGTSAGPPFALVVLSTTDPGLANYPDGTIWVQP